LDPRADRSRCFCCVGVLAAAPAVADTFPSRAIPSRALSPGDRPIPPPAWSATHGHRLDQSVVIENVHLAAAARSPPAGVAHAARDGHTILIHQLAIAANVTLQAAVRHEKELTGIGLVNSAPMCWSAARRFRRRHGGDDGVMKRTGPEVKFAHAAPAASHIFVQHCLRIARCAGQHDPLSRGHAGADPTFSQATRISIAPRPRPRWSRSRRTSSGVESQTTLLARSCSSAVALAALRRSRLDLLHRGRARSNRYPRACENVGQRRRAPAIRIMLTVTPRRLRKQCCTRCARLPSGMRELHLGTRALHHAVISAMPSAGSVLRRPAPSG